MGGHHTAAPRRLVGQPVVTRPDSFRTVLRQEARWIGDWLASIADDALFPILNVGSHTERFRTTEQPWIDRHVFAPLRQRGEVIHTDLRAADGVDIVGDLTDRDFRDHLRGLGARSLLCCNLLEHVPDRPTIAAALQDLVAPGGHAVVSVPYRFPYHADPVDTMYRPRPAEIATLFPQLRTVADEIVVCQTWLTYLAGRVAASPSTVVREVLLRRQRVPAEPPPDEAESLWSWSFRRFEVSCVAMVNDA